MAERSLRGSRLGATSYETDEGVEVAERQPVTYDCPNGHATTVPFSIEADIPDRWECRTCGAVAEKRHGEVADPKPVKLLAALEDACAETEDPDTIREALDELSWSLLDVTLQAAPAQALARSAAFADPHRGGLSAEHARLLAAIRRDAGLVD